jgi:hypothetical protein
MVNPDGTSMELPLTCPGVRNCRLRATLTEPVDREGMPTYLESSNPANNHRHERLGFAKIGEFFPPSSDIPVTTMWRDAGEAGLSGKTA